MSECKKLKRELEANQNNLEEANAIQEQLEGVSKEMTKKILGIIEEFSTQKKPLYDKRHAVLLSIPHFWATAVNIQLVS